jgi:hypothetical protein
VTFHLVVTHGGPYTVSQQLGLSCNVSSISAKARLEVPQPITSDELSYKLSYVKPEGLDGFCAKAQQLLANLGSATIKEGARWE